LQLQIWLVAADSVELAGHSQLLFFRFKTDSDEGRHAQIRLASTYSKYY